ncbi:DUF1810 domain-containing protein [Aliarcobacter cryaerophilus]|uniref:DUF1810 domain-containing protein n=1 Tax=Aliarcobacter cryaerophilus TaxID=28198 RepID=UPI0021B5364B|nr:DUF1810 domain-containing protein [Aliarcobacter cryaerophilus]MCT7515495.1 DUF1810 domain-containing protein [Aliarcobacter cryaerophilus]
MKRFIEAQNPIYNTVIDELKQQQKNTHWMWFIFPQIEGLGQSDIAKKYSLTKEEAIEYTKNTILKERLIECCELLLKSDKSATQILGPIDAMKLKSSMTLFDALHLNEIYEKVLNKFFDDKCDFTVQKVG